MTEKRFVSEDGCCGYYTEIIDNEKELDLSLPNPKKNLTIEELVDLMNELADENEQLKEHLSTWRSSCCNYLNVYSILDNEVSILKETKDLDRFFEKFDKYSRIPFYEVEKSFIELQKENEQLKKDFDSCSHNWALMYDEAKNKVEELSEEIEQLKSENKRLTDKLNKTALELVDECVSQGKATEISEMSYREFLDYRAKNGKPMELKK